MSSRNIYIFIGFVVIACITMVGVIYVLLPVEARLDLLSNIAKSFLQLGTLGTLGVLVKFAIDQISVAAERRKEFRELKKELLSRLRGTHQTIRGVPYLIEQEKTVSAYKEQMRKLLAARIMLTDIGNDIKTSEIPGLRNAGLKKPLKSMMKYLSELLRESVEVDVESWKDIENLPQYRLYREATLQFSGTDTKSTLYALNYDSYYENAKKKLTKALTNI